MSEKITNYLKTNTTIAATDINSIIACFKKRSIKKNTILVSEGETCREMYFVHSGCVRTYYLTKQGKEKTRYIAFANSFVTSISSFIAQQPTFEFVEALETSELYAIRHSDFYQLISTIPQWEYFYRSLLERAYLFQHKKIEDLVTLSAKQRFDKVMEETPFYVQRLSNKILASYLDITQETLSRLKTK